MSKWISVNQALPKCNRKSNSFGTQVLVWPYIKSVGCADSPTAFYGCRVTDEPTFYLYGKVVEGVTHWMPLPEKP